ncbi:hypothetical protein F4782DRAFT_303928 [Xylaria castorea]|nr:hypothetical protein F4782DRAFT_303928 [Xylaria castorea]
MPSILSYIQQWAPFKIDALGLVTLLGAAKIDQEVGQLCYNRYTEYMPLLGAFVIADDQLVRPIAGFTLYNISDGIVATDLAGWFERWLQSRDLTFCSSTVTVSVAAKEYRPRPADRLISYALALLAPFLVVWAGLLGDYWGLANGLAVLSSIAARFVVLSQNRAAVDRAVESDNIGAEPVKVLVALPDGKVVTIQTTRNIVLECLLTTPRPFRPLLYLSARAFGWTAFGVHVVALGMASLSSQLITIALLLGATIAVAWQIGADPERIGRRLVLKRHDSHVPFRAAAYARFDLSKDEEESMMQWNLFPHRSNKAWWAKYTQAKQLGDFARWDRVLSQSIPHSDDKQPGQ